MRLIDADKMLEELGISDRDIYCKCLIEEQPTAFDVEAVVKELEEYVEQHKDYYQIGEDFLCYGACIPWKKAIEIVRKGGVK